jgi:LysM repeat protein
MRVEPKTAGAIAAGAFFFLLIFGVGWPGPGSWLLIFALLFIAAAAVAWWLDGAIVQEARLGGAVAAGGASPFRGGAAAGAPAAGGDRIRRSRDSLLLSLGLPGPDAAGRWVLPSNVHVTLVAGAVGLLAMIIFVGGALSGGGSSPAPTVTAPQNSEALDFAQPITPAESAPIVTEAVTAGSTTVDPSPIVVETPNSAARPDLPRPADPIDAVGTPLQPASTVVHEVVSGDTIYDLAISYGSSIEGIMNANGIGEFDTIRVGDQILVPVLKAPPPSSEPEAPAAAAESTNSITHTVVAGDTIYDLAIFYGSDVDAILSANGLNEFSAVLVDDELIIPVP